MKERLIIIWFGRPPIQNVPRPIECRFYNKHPVTYEKVNINSISLIILS